MRKQQSKTAKSKSEIVVYHFCCTTGIEVYAFDTELSSSQSFVTEIHVSVCVVFPSQVVWLGV
jgi:hypothetical protein